jgi:mRNA interferase MazF
MERFVKGDVVVLPFPYSDLTVTKKRPALILAELEGNDYIICQITSQAKPDRYACPIGENDFLSGSLNKPSLARANKLFTADNSIILYRAGTLKEEKVKAISGKIIELING